MSITPAAPRRAAGARHRSARMLRDGDTLKITRLDRLGRSVLHLVTLGAGDHTVQQIADPFSVPRTTVYGHLDDASKGKRPASHRNPKSPADASGG